jgi:hypothetical protein
MKSRRAVEVMERAAGNLEQLLQAVAVHLYEIQRLAIEAKRKDIWTEAKKALSKL